MPCRAIARIAAQPLRQLRPNIHLTQIRWRLPGSCEKEMSASTTPNKIKQQVADQNYFWQSNSSAKGLAL
jgi:hypothetical protein